MGNEYNNLTKKSNKKEKHLQKIRWFYTESNQAWTKSIVKENLHPFPLELCEEIEEAYTNLTPFQYENKTILFDYKYSKHVQIINSNAWKNINVIRDEITNVTSITRLSMINSFSPILLDQENYQKSLIDSMSILLYKDIFGFLGYNQKDEFVTNILKCNTLLSKKFVNFLKGEYKNRLKNINKENIQFSFEALKKILIYDFSKKQCLVKYYLRDLTKDNFCQNIVHLFLEETHVFHDIINHDANHCVSNIELTTFYLCVIYALTELSEKTIIEYKAYIASSNNYPMLKPRNYYSNHSILLGSKNSIKEDLSSTIFEITIEKEPEDILYLNHSPFDISKKSLFKDNTIVFPSNTVFRIDNVYNKTQENNDSQKQITITYIAMTVMQKVISGSLSLMNLEQKEKFGIYEDLIKYNDSELQNCYYAKIKARHIKYLKKMYNCMAIELYGNDIGNEGMICLSSNFKTTSNLLSLSLIGNDIGFEGFEIFNENLKYISHLRYLNLSFNFLKDNDIYVIHFDCLKELQYFIIRENQITENGLNHIIKEIKNCSYLRVLDLYDNIIKDEGLINLSKEIHHFKYLQLLDIWNCSITEKGLVEFMSKILNHQEIESLNFKNNLIGGDQIIQSIIKSVNTLPRLRYLNLSQTKLTEEQLKEIIIQLKLQNSQWTYNCNSGALVLIQQPVIDNEKCYNNQVDYLNRAISRKRKKQFHRNSMLTINNIDNIVSIIPNIDECSTVLKCNLTNACLKDKGLILFCTLLKRMPLIEYLNLSFNELQTEGLTFLSQSLHFLPNLKYFDLSSNNIGDNNLMMLSKVIFNSSIEELVLCWNALSDKGMQTCLSQLRDNSRLKILDLYGNYISDGGIEVLVQKSTLLNKLTSINLGKNNIGNIGMKLLAESFEKFNELVSLDLSYNHFTDDGIKEFYSHMEHVLNLTYLNISHNNISSGIKNSVIALGIPSSFIL